MWSGRWPFSIGMKGMRKDWYEHRHELQPEQVFSTYCAEVVCLNRRVPGDGSRWYVDSYNRGGWYDDNETIEPGDLVDLLGTFQNWER